MAATVPMTVVMGVFQNRTHPTTRIAPSEVVHRAEEKADLDDDIGETTHETFTGVAHFAFGAAAGAGFGIGGVRKRPVLAGVLYGASIYAVAYTGVLPKLRLMPPPGRDRAPRQLATFLSHIVWGAALGGVFALLNRRR